MPRRSSCPLLPYWPLASQVRPSLIGFLAPCAQTRLCRQGPKNAAVPAAIRLPLTMSRREGRITIPGLFFIASSLKSADRRFDVSPFLRDRINILLLL